jgi:uncharacterized membrane protein
MTDTNLGADELQKLDAIERLVSSLREDMEGDPETLSSKAAGKIAQLVGSWKFLITQCFVLLVYMSFNVYLLKTAAFDPYPFILLNLCLSFQAAFTAPIILMAQNRADAKDRRQAQKAYKQVRHIEELMRVLTQYHETGTQEGRGSSDPG